ncbi:carbohydrate sulfotransferase 3-like [Glandiceps talaboti]
MRTGSTLTGSYFSLHPEFFYVYEPGHMIIEFNKMNLFVDDFDYLEQIRPELVNFMHSFFQCNFTGRQYYFDSLNKNKWQRYFSSFLDIPLPIKESDVTQRCQSKQHIVTKIIRLNNILFAAPELKKDNVKVIHLVRDPRGMASSRREFERIKDGNALNDKFRLPEKLEEVITDDCIWLDTNYLSAKNADDTFKKNYMLVRYEDLADRPSEIVPKMYDFVGIPMHQVIKDKIEAPGQKLGNGQAWRKKLNFDEVRRIQEICPDRVFKTFGYVKVENADQLTNTETSLVLPFPVNDDV